MSNLANRVQRAVESVLENEGLVGGLDEAAASALQDWGISNVKKIAEETGDLDDEQAEEAMYPKMKASRSLMRAVRVWVEHEAKVSAEERVELWTKIEKKAQALYGEELRLPDAATFSGANTLESIKKLLAWFEDYAGRGADSGEKKKGFFQSLFNR